jgi:uncharacterized membrane protein YesL
MLDGVMDKEKQFEDVMGKLKQFENVMGKIKPQELKATSTTKDVVKKEKQEVSVKTKPHEWKTESIKGEGGGGCVLAILIVLAPLVYFLTTDPDTVMGLLIMILFVLFISGIILGILKSL